MRKVNVTMTVSLGSIEYLAHVEGDDKPLWEHKIEYESTPGPKDFVDLGISIALKLQGSRLVTYRQIGKLSIIYK